MGAREGTLRIQVSQLRTLPLKGYPRRALVRDMLSGAKPSRDDVTLDHRSYATQSADTGKGIVRIRFLPAFALFL